MTGSGSTSGKYPSFDLFSDPPPPNITLFQQQYVRDFDWGSSPLGAVAGWSPQLRQLVNIIQRDTQGSCIYWDVAGNHGSPDVVIVYNEAYTYLIGHKHPSLQGTDPKFGFAEIWDQFAELLEVARQSGNTVEDRNAFLLLERHGFLEETYFSWKFIPIVGPEGYVVGSYATVFESTQDVIGARRLATMQNLGHIISSTRDGLDVWRQILTGLEDNENDIPLAVLYSVVDSNSKPITDGSQTGSSYYYLEGTIGVATDLPISPSLVDLSKESRIGWATIFRKAIVTKETYLVLNTHDGSLPADMLDGITWRGFGVPSTQVVVCPIRSPNTSAVLNFLIIALNPRRPYDKEYENWIELLMKSIATPHFLAAFATADSAKLSERLVTQTRDLLESEKKFLQFARRSTVGILIVDIQGNLLFSNNAWFDMIMGSATSRDDFTRAIHPDDRNLRHEKWVEMIRDKVPVNYQMRLLRPWRPPPSLSPDAGETCTYVLISCWPDLDSDGNVLSVMATSTDISEIKFIEEQLRQKTVDAEHRVTQQEAFVDMVSHEIRNPLSAILHCADEISTSLTRQISKHTPSALIDETHNLIQAADTIAYCAMHQKRIVDDILTLSKLDSNLLDVFPQPVEPIDLVETALRMFDTELKKLDIQFQMVVSQSIRDLDISWLLFDSSRFLQVLLNLMTNAVKFTRKTTGRREVTVTISATLQAPPDSSGSLIYVPLMDRKQPSPVWADWRLQDTVFLSCSVSDTGQGITAEELKGLFHRFSQASPKTHVQYGGSGLGLYISRQLSEMQGGKIGVKSEYGVGSTFTFYIRTCRTEKPSGNSGLKAQITNLDQVKEELPNACGSGTGLFDNSESAMDMYPGSAPLQSGELDQNVNGPKINISHILIVEDNIVNQKVLAKQLRNHGYQVSVANHGHEAIAFLKSTSFWAGNEHGSRLSIVLMDLEMPIMDGLTCVRKIRDFERSGEIIGHVPVIAVTANARSQQIQIAADAGMDDVVTKPYRMSEILSHISDLLGKETTLSNQGVKMLIL